MTVNSSYHELVHETVYLQRLLQLLDIHSMVNGGYNWKIGEKGEMREIRTSLTGKIDEKAMSAKNLAILAISFSQGNELSSEQKFIDQERLLHHGIVTIEQITGNMQHFIEHMSRDHITNSRITGHIVSNNAKICILRTAYDRMEKHFCDNPEEFEDPECMVLLGIIMVILGDRYEMRPYMVNPRLKGIDWGEIYNLMFQNFNDASKEKYAEAGYFSLWEIFRSIRDEIFCKKKQRKKLSLCSIDGKIR